MEKTPEHRVAPDRAPEDRAMRRAHQAVAGVGVLLSVAGFAFAGWGSALGVLAGATIASANLYVLARTVHNMVSGHRASWGGVALIKFILLLAVTYGLIAGHVVEPLALACGFGALPIGILIAGVLGGAAEAPLPLQLSTSANASTDHA